MESSETTDTARLQAAFPRALCGEVAAAVALLPAPKLAPTDHDIGPVRFGDEALRIPCRIYHPEPAQRAAQALDATERLVLTCLLTRHHDGHVRERNVQSLLLAREPWVAPFVVQLLGEYVVEIAMAIADAIDNLDRTVYAAFAAANAPFLGLTRRRAVSYWNEYYRLHWPRFAEYPAYRALLSLGLWEPNAAPRPPR